MVVDGEFYGHSKAATNLLILQESIFSATSSHERKYTGFQLMESALKQAPDVDKLHLFTKNFIRVWINQLSKKDRYLHKAALKLVCPDDPTIHCSCYADAVPFQASTVHGVVKESPSTGFPLVVRLLGPNGSRDFDRITNTKTVEVILGSISTAQLMEYVQHLAGVFQDTTSK